MLIMHDIDCVLAAVKHNVVYEIGAVLPCCANESLCSPIPERKRFRSSPSVSPDWLSIFPKLSPAQYKQSASIHFHCSPSNTAKFLRPLSLPLNIYVGILPGIFSPNRDDF